MAYKPTKLDTDYGIPLHVQLREIIKGQIESGELKAGELVPSEKELVERYQISRGPIRQAYQQLVNEGLLSRARGKGTFVSIPGNTHSPGVSDPSSTISFVLNCDTAEAMSSYFVSSVQSLAFERGYEARIFGAKGETESDDAYIARVCRANSAGVLLMPDPTVPKENVNLEMCRRFDELQIPYVLIDLYLPKKPSHFVCSDNREGGRLLGSYLKQMGHRCIAAISDCINSSTQDRLTGLAEGLGSDNTELFSYVYKLSSEEDLEGKIDNVLSHPQRPTAIYASCDWIASNILRILKSQGIRVPDDISLVGFDDLDFVQFITPPLTTVRQDFEGVGREALKTLLDVIENPDQPLRQFRIPVELVVRDSVKNLNS